MAVGPSNVMLQRDIGGKVPMGGQRRIDDLLERSSASEVTKENLTITSKNPSTTHTLISPYQ